MKQHFICLANSKKYTNRCIAGIALIESKKQKNRFGIVKQDEEPVWFRPVTNTDHGAVPTELVDHINLLDIIAFEVTEPCPVGYQTENVFFDDQPMKIVKKVDPSPEKLDLLVTPGEKYLFGNAGRAVLVEDARRLTRSLVFIRPEEVKFYLTTTFKGSSQVRAKFIYKALEYDLPVTDIQFFQRFTEDPEIVDGFKDIYFTISLGIEFEGWHYKLIAGVVTNDRTGIP